MGRFTVDELISASVAFDCAARLVQVEPDRAWIESCISGGLFDEIPFGGCDDAVQDGLSFLRDWCAAAQGDTFESVATLRREWLRLFIGLGIPEASINESYYIESNSVMFGRSTLSVRSAYRAWGLQNERGANEPDDALGVMLAFCAFLMREAARACSSNDGEASSRALDALEGFLVQHMLPWVSAWRFLVRQHAQTDYYRGVGELVFGLERACAACFGIAFSESDGSFSYVRSEA